MSFAQVIRSLFEVVLVVFAIWAVFHEDIFVALEERIAARFKRRRLSVLDGSSARMVR